MSDADDVGRGQPGRGVTGAYPVAGLLRPHTGPRRVGPGSVLATVSAGAALAATQLTILVPGLSKIRDQLGDASLGSVSWLLLGYGLVVALALPAGGLLARRLGRRRLYVGGTVLFTLAAVVAALAPNLAVLLGARLAQGLGGGILIPASLGLAVAAHPRDSRARVVPLWAGAVAGSAVLGLPLGEVLVRLGGWRTALWVTAALGLAAALAARRLLVEHRSPRVPDGPGGSAAEPRPSGARAPRTAGNVGSLTSSDRAQNSKRGQSDQGERIEVVPDASSAAASRPAQHGENPLFFQLPEISQRRLAAGNRHQVAAGDWIVRAGETASAMFVIVSGRAEVLIGDDPVRELGPGSVVGELALLTGGVRSASVRARRDCEVIEVSRQAWDSAVLTDPAAVATLVRAIAGQLADTAPTRPLPSPRPAVIGIVAGSDHPTAGTSVDRGTGADPGVQSVVNKVAATLHDLLRAHGRVVVLPRGAASALEAAERDNDWVLFSSDGSDAQWHDYVLRQSDRLVLVTQSTRPACVLPRAIGHQPELLLVGERPDSSTFTAWTECIDPWRVTIAREDRLKEDLRALSARLAGRSIGLVLSGGGARAMTHIGVILELEEAGIQIDRVAGSSLGAIVGAVYAAGASASELAERGYSALVRGRPFSDYTVPGKALTRGRRHLRLLQEHLGGLLIEELPRGFQCVSADLRTRSLWVHSCGSLALAAAASSRIPVLFPPIVDGPRLLIDGGVLDNLPVQLVTDRDEGPVIAVNVLPDDLDAAQRAAGPAVIPSVTETLLRTVEINADEENRAIRAGAHVITPRTMGVGVLEFHQFDLMVESGRLAARELLEATGGDLHSTSST